MIISTILNVYKSYRTRTRIIISFAYYVRMQYKIYSAYVSVNTERVNFKKKREEIWLKV